MRAANHRRFHWQSVFCWAWLVVMVLFAVTVAIGTHHWIEYENNNVEINIGLTTACQKTPQFTECGRYGTSLSDIPIKEWRIAVGFYATGVILAWLGFLMHFFLYLPTPLWVLPLVQTILVLAGLLLTTGLLVFAGELDELDPNACDEFICVCHDADRFSLGNDCELDWSAIVGIIGAGLAFISAIVATWLPCKEYDNSERSDSEIDAQSPYELYALPVTSPSTPNQPYTTPV
eukprot:m.17864 g.17864  ORF g.17864 m.17864 type:complete len:233 (-) comp11509_c0_seq2:322-1020(-)